MERIGSGRFSLLYVIQEGTDIYVLKTIKDNFLQNSRIVQNFSKEIDIWYKLSGTSFIARAINKTKEKSKELPFQDIRSKDYQSLSYAKLTISSDLWLIREYVDGISLEDLLSKENGLSILQSINFSLKICEIMDKVHKLLPSFTHRDIKPTKFIITKDCKLKLIDLGLAKSAAWQEEILRFSKEDIAYMAPEVERQKSYSIKSDIFSFGITFGRLLTGTSAAEIRSRGIELLREKGIIKEVVYFFGKCTREFAKNRYSSFSEIKEDLLDIRNFFIKEHDMQRCLKCGYIPRISLKICPVCGEYFQTSKEIKKNARILVKKAIEISRTPDSLEEAIFLLKEAINLDPSLRKVYGHLLTLWKKGVIM